jgi:hypothetical protein
MSVWRPTWNDVMNVMLPPTNGVAPHPRWFGVIRPRGSSPHRGIDFNYVGGQTGLNLTHPDVYSPISGTVTAVGGDKFNTISIRDSDGFVHNILHTQSQFVEPGQQVTAGQVIAAMSGVGAEGVQHVHYGMRDPNGALINPADYWSGKLGTAPPVLPAQPIPYLKKTLDAQQALGATSWLQPGNSPSVLSPSDAAALATRGARYESAIPYLDQTSRPPNSPNLSAPPSVTKSPASLVPPQPPPRAPVDTRAISAPAWRRRESFGATRWLQDVGSGASFCVSARCGVRA